MIRVGAYIDGFNLYYGLRTKGWRRYYWLNLQRLAENLLKPGQRLVSTKYFTARVSSTPADPLKNKRQSTYLDALGVLPGFHIYFGKYFVTPKKCRRCGLVENIPDEKMTDVNIAVQLLVDAFRDMFDEALLVSADSDLVGPVLAVRKLFPQKRVVAVFPPNRSSFHLRQAANACFTIGRRNLAKSQFPPEVRAASGLVFRRPPEWT
jgi:uncharacterized LabA/DUF88 family protein